MSTPARPNVPYPALAAAFVAWAEAKRRLEEAFRLEQEAHAAFDRLALAHLSPDRKLVVDFGDRQEGDAPAARLGGSYAILTQAPAPPGPQAGVQVHVELVRK